jgi:hypothetical protein
VTGRGEGGRREKTRRGSCAGEEGEGGNTGNVGIGECTLRGGREETRRGDGRGKEEGGRNVNIS